MQREGTASGEMQAVYHTTPLARTPAKELKTPSMTHFCISQLSAFTWHHRFQQDEEHLCLIVPVLCKVPRFLNRRKRGDPARILHRAARPRVIPDDVKGLLISLLISALPIAIIQCFNLKHPCASFVSLKLGASWATTSFHTRMRTKCSGCSSSSFKK